MALGRFITFEGSEGCGKSTQVRRLAGRIGESASAPALLVVREPGGTAVGEKVRELLQFAPEGQGMEPVAELLLFAASRAQLVGERLRPALEAGQHVLADRFIDSTTVYQGAGRGIDPEAIAAVNRIATGGLVPDTTFLLDMDSGLARERAGAGGGGSVREDRMESEPDEFYQRVREAYLAVAAADPGRVVVLDAGLDEESLADLVWQTLEIRHGGLFS